jgi:hypothetical protein
VLHIVTVLDEHSLSSDGGDLVELDSPEPAAYPLVQGLPPAV